MTVTYVEVPEYQPSSASITVGDPFYQTSQKAENVKVKRAGLDAGTVALIAIPVSIFLIWLWKHK